MEYLQKLYLEQVRWPYDSLTRESVAPLGKLGKRLPRLMQSENPAERERQIVESMADSVVERLKAKGLQAQRLLHGSRRREPT